MFAAEDDAPVPPWAVASTLAALALPGLALVVWIVYALRRGR